MEDERIAFSEVFQKTIDFLNQKIDMIFLEYLYRKYDKELDDETRRQNRQMTVDSFGDVLSICKGTMLYYYFASFAICATGDAAIFDDFLRTAAEDSTLSYEQKFRIYFYATKLNFLSMVDSGKESAELMDNLYQCIYEGYRDAVHFDFSYIEEKDRNKDFVIVLTTQLLGMLHGPTKTTFDRAYILKKYMGKEVLILNSAEFSGDGDCIYLYNMSSGLYAEEYNGQNAFWHNDLLFPVMQFPEKMPQVSGIRKILELVSENKPYCIVSIGGISIAADLCSKIVPTITISTVPSGRTQTRGQFQAIGRKVGENDLLWAKKHGLPEDHFIESVFTSAFKKQETVLNRAQLGLPEDGFIAALIGFRLDSEIDTACEQVLLNLMEKGIYIAMIGRFDRYEKLREKHKEAEKYLINLGGQDDILAVLECVDLVINPKRTGGGTSVAEALYKEIPVVTLNFGDGGLGAGKDFWVSDYGEMYQAVLRYASDRKFYQEKQEQAKERAKVLTDSKHEFIKIIQKAMERDAFH